MHKFRAWLCCRYSMMTKTFWSHGGLQTSITVSNPPNFLDPVQVRRLEEMVDAFSGTEYTMNRKTIEDCHCSSRSSFKKADNQFLPKCSSEFHLIDIQLNYEFITRKIKFQNSTSFWCQALKIFKKISATHKNFQATLPCSGMIILKFGMKQKNWQLSSGVIHYK